MTALYDALTEPYGIHRHVSALLCILAFAGLVWRLVGRLNASRTLVSALTALLAALELIVALGSARRAAIGGPFNEAQWFVLAHAVVVLVIVATWDRIPQHDPLGRRLS